MRGAGPNKERRENAAAKRYACNGIRLYPESTMSTPLSYSSPAAPVPVTTTFTIEGYRIVQYLGVVRGLIVRAPTIAQGFFGGLKSIIGGRIGAYTQMCEQTRQQAYELLIDHARAVGANAIVGFRYDASEIGGKGVAATEVLCYGTAVIIAPEHDR
jgi:uncharacterized protein YbjQ (UPF0145 family)